jgi:hypothetical protein
MEKKAEYQLTTSVNEGMFEIIMTGKVTASTVENLDKEVTAIVKANGIDNLLVNIHALEGRFRIAETYLYVRHSLSGRQTVNDAVVNIPENASFLAFYKDIASYAVLSVKGFTNIDATRDWLNQQVKRYNSDNLTLLSFNP